MSVITDLYFDPQNRCLVIRDVDETGAVIATAPQLSLKLTDLAYATEFIAKLRRVHYTDAVSGDKKRCYGVFTKPESDAATDGHDSSTEDLRIGGGGGGVGLYLVKEVYSDYYLCHSWDGTTEGTEPVYVAKPWELRHSLTSETVEGDLIDYTYEARANNIDNTGKQRRAVLHTDTDPSSTQIEIVVPVWQVDCRIVAATPDGGTEVFAVDDEPVTLLDLNVAGRGWRQVD